MISRFRSLISAQLILAAACSYAQSTRLEIGAWAAYEISSFEFEDFHFAQEEPNEEPGPSLGLLAAIPIGEKASIRTGVGFVRKGFEVEWDWIATDPQDPSIPIVTTFRASYLQIPVLLDYPLFEHLKFTVYPSIGVQAGMFLQASASSVMGNGAEGEETIVEVEWKEIFLQARAGLGYEMPVSDWVDIRLEPYILFGIGDLAEDYVKPNSTAIGALMQFVLSFGERNQATGQD